MFRTGTKVVRLTKKVGQAAPQGTVKAIHGDSVEVTWEDGHTSLISHEALAPLTKANEPHKA